MNMDAKLIKEILDLHAKYLAGVDGGKKADLSGANLSGADNEKLTLIGDRDIILRESLAYKEKEK
jgi:uncharacterized protein YjbI with pentapeptide repeats